MSDNPVKVSDATELLSCPFCGGRAYLNPWVFDSHDSFVECLDCQIMGPTANSANATWADSSTHAHLREVSNAEAVAAWNRRAIPSPSPVRDDNLDAGNAEADRLPLVDSVILGELLRLPVDGKSLRLAAMQVRLALAQRGLLAAAPAPVGSEPVTWPEAKPLTFRYTNYRGETSDRIAYPRRVWWGSTDWHPEPQWLLTAWDVEKDAERDFAISDMSSAQALSDAHSAGMREGMEKAAQAMNAVEDDDESLANAIHAELKRQQAFSIERYGKIALAEGPIIRLVVEAIRTRAAAIRSLQPALDQPKDTP